MAVVLTKAMAVAITISVTCRDSPKMYMLARSVVEANLYLSRHNIALVIYTATTLTRVCHGFRSFFNDVRANPSLAATRTHRRLLHKHWIVSQWAPLKTSLTLLITTGKRALRMQQPQIITGPCFVQEGENFIFYLDMACVEFHVKHQVLSHRKSETERWKHAL